MIVELSMGINPERACITLLLLRKAHFSIASEQKERTHRHSKANMKETEKLVL